MPAPPCRVVVACGELFGRRPSSPQPAPATPRPTRMAKPSTVFGALAPWSSATPAPITGTESPTKSAMSSSEVIATRFSGAVPSSTRPVVPLKTAPAPAPIRPPLTRNSARLGRRKAHGRHEQHETDEHRDRAEREHARRAQPRRRELGRHPRREDDEQRRARQARATDGRSVVARNSPDSPAKSPLAAKAARVAAPAGTGSLTGNGARAGRRRTPSPARPRGRPARPPRARSRRR